MPTLADIADFCDTLLGSRGFPDYRQALNGIQVDREGEVGRIAAAVDARERTIRRAIDRGAELLLVHHGLFWSGLQPLVGRQRRRLAPLLAGNIGVYASHLPLDAHPEIGNGTLLAGALELHATGTFGQHEGISVGVMGDDRIDTAALVRRAATFAARYDGAVRTSHIPSGHLTTRWAIVTGSGAGPDMLAEAADRGVDTLVTGEGAHHTAIDAEEAGIVIIYAGHYATETLGVQALAARVAERFGVPWEFLHEPTGL